MAKGRHHNQKKGKFWTFSKIGGGGQKKPNKSKIQIRTFENRWGGLNFSIGDHMGL